MLNEVQMFFTLPISLAQHVKAGKLRALAVTGTKRSTSFPDVTTLEEAGLMGYEAVGLHGLLAPRPLRAPWGRPGGACRGVLARVDACEQSGGAIPPPPSRPIPDNCLPPPVR